MFTFLQPVWLWAISGIIVPVFIHLWNVRQGKVLQVGSIALIRQSDRQQAKSLRLKDRLLLLMRCLLIVLLSMLLAEPIFREELSANDEKGWVLMERQVLKETYGQFTKEIDSLMKAGYTFHYYEENFPDDKLSDAIKAVSDTIDQKPLNYWQLLPSLSQQVPDSLPVYLYTQNGLIHFAGSRPAVSINLHWQTYTAKDSAASYITQAYTDALGNIKASLLTSAPSSAVARWQSLSRLELPAGFELLNDSSGLTVQYKDSLGHISKTTVDTATTRVVIYANSFTHDAVYVQAALNAVAAFSSRKIITSTVKKPGALPADADWLFWLSNEPMPPAAKFKKAFVYAPGEVQNIMSWVADAENWLPPEETVSIFKRIAPAKTAGQNVICTDGFGDPLLTVEVDDRALYRFYSHFDPAWNDLVWNPHFAEWVMTLIINEPKPTPVTYDKRIVAASQLLPTVQTKGAAVKQNLLRTHDRSFIFWLVAFALFCLERYLSFGKKKEVANG